MSKPIRFRDKSGNNEKYLLLAFLIDFITTSLLLLLLLLLLLSLLLLLLLLLNNKALWQGLAVVAKLWLLEFNYCQSNRTQWKNLSVYLGFLDTIIG